MNMNKQLLLNRIQEYADSYQANFRTFDDKALIEFCKKQIKQREELFAMINALPIEEGCYDVPVYGIARKESNRHTVHIFDMAEHYLIESVQNLSDPEEWAAERHIELREAQKYHGPLES